MRSSSSLRKVLFHLWSNGLYGFHRDELATTTMRGISRSPAPARQARETRAAAGERPHVFREPVVIGIEDQLEAFELQRMRRRSDENWSIFWPCGVAAYRAMPMRVASFVVSI